MFFFLKSSKFLKQLWCCIGKGCFKIIWFYTLIWRYTSFFLSVNPLLELWQRTNAWNISYRNSLQWPINIINLVDGAKLLYF